MTLSKQQKAAVAKVIETALAGYHHSLVHSKTNAERQFYQNLIGDTEPLLPLFKNSKVVEVEEDEEEEEEEEEET